MIELPPIPRDQRKIDGDHLNLLSIFHFVGAGLALLALLFLAIHFVFFHAMLSNPQMWQGKNQTPPPPQLFAMLKWFYLMIGLWFIGSGILNLLSAFFLRARKHRTFSLVVGAINCLHIPLGTVLGVFTIIVLVRQSVRELYESAAS